MYFLFLIIGGIFGFIISIIINQKKNIIYGYIDVDSKSGLCKVHISSDQLENPKVKHVLFTVNHNISLKLDDIDPRDEQPL